MGDRHGPTPPHQERPHGQPAPETAAQPGDTAVVAAGAAAAFALLRERVLAATRCRALGRLPATAMPGGAAYGSRGAATAAAAALAAIENEQRWLAAGRLELDAAALRCAFVEGLDEAEAILREVAPGDEAAAAWFLAVRGAHAARVGPYV